MFINKIRIRIFISVILLLSACAPRELPPIEKPKAISLGKGQNSGTIFLNRQNARQLGFVTADILLNGERVGKITNGQCVRLTVPAGSHNLQLTEGNFGAIGAALGNAIAKSIGKYNVKITKGQQLHYFAQPVYDSPNVGWLFQTTQQTSGRKC